MDTRYGRTTLTEEEYHRISKTLEAGENLSQEDQELLMMISENRAKKILDNLE